MRIALTLLLLSGPIVPIGAAPGDAAPPIKAITAPSQDLTLAFTSPGRIAKLSVREGERVRAGQLLVQLDDSVESKRASLLKAKADDTTAVKAAELRLARKKTILQKVQKAYAENAAPERELDDARIDVALAELDVRQAQIDHAQDEGRYEEAALSLDRMRLTSPIDGEVERIFLRAGEVVGLGKSLNKPSAVMRVVRTDPLWIDVPTPTDQARRLAPGQVAHVRFRDGPTDVKAKVVRISKVADAASETLEVRLELPNPTARPAGEQVTVRFPAAAPAAGRPKPPPPDDGPGAR